MPSALDFATCLRPDAIALAVSSLFASAVLAQVPAQEKAADKAELPTVTVTASDTAGNTSTAATSCANSAVTTRRCSRSAGWTSSSTTQDWWVLVPPLRGLSWGSWVGEYSPTMSTLHTSKLLPLPLPVPLPEALPLLRVGVMSVSGQRLRPKNLKYQET